MRPGWGERHPWVRSLIEGLRPDGTQEEVWAGGALPLRISAYRGVVELPDELVTSIRCVVRVGDAVVVCTNADGSRHSWPGGRREPGESFTDTARREVHEETGWLLEPGSLEQLGWLHFENLLEGPPDDVYPFPDFLQVVYAGRASGRDPAQGDSWIDVEGYELSSQLVPLSEAVELVELDPLAKLFLEMLR